MQLSRRMPTWRQFQFAGFGFAIWLLGLGLMELSLGSPLFRLAYDTLHLVTTHPAPSKVVIVVLNEDTDRKLNRPQNEPFSRRSHAELLRRLKQAGVARVCFDVIFDLPSREPGADAEFAAAIRAHGHVVLGGAEQMVQSDALGVQKKPIEPVEILRQAAESWGILNVAHPDPDGVIRRAKLESEVTPTLAAAAAKARQRAEGGDLRLPGEGTLYYYQVPPSSWLVFEFANCLAADKELPEGVFNGATVFVGGNYKSFPAGRPDSFPTPYSRFGYEEIPGVVWHANAFLNFREGQWLERAGLAWNVLLSLVLPVTWWLLSRRRPKKGEICVFTATAGIGVMLVCIYAGWNSRVVVSWPAIVLAQLPLALAGTLLLGGRESGVVRIRIFFSAVTAEFGAYRKELRKGFARLHIDWRDQEMFQKSLDDTLVMLDEEIKACDAVIHLCGDLTGSRPRQLVWAALLEKRPDFVRKIPRLREYLATGGIPSFTQIEAYLAIYHGKPMIVSEPFPGADRGPGDEVERGPSVPQAPASEQKEAQQAHLARLKDAGKYTAFRFSDPTNLGITIMWETRLLEQVLSEKSR